MVRIRKLLLTFLLVCLYAAVLPEGICGAAAGVPGMDEAGCEIRSHDLRFCVTVPEGWEDLSETLINSGSSRGFLICCGKKASAAFLVFACEPVSDAVPDMEAYLDILEEGVTGEETFTDIVLSDPIPLTLKGSGYKGSMAEFTAEYAGIPVTARLYVYQGVDEYYQFFAWTAQEHAEEALPEIERITASFAIER